MSAPISVLSYNLWHGRAQGELPHLERTYQPDVICIQEARGHTLATSIDGMQLAITTARNRLGVGVYVRRSRFAIEEARVFNLAVSRHDRLVGGTDQRLAAARVRDLQNQRQLVFGSFHATPFTDSNAVRRRQVDEAHRALADLGPGLPVAMAGDYNHPLLLFMLGLHVRRQGFALAHTSSSTFHKDGSIMRGKFDVATVSQLEVSACEVLAQGASDHKPVLFTMDYTE